MNSSDIPHEIAYEDEIPYDNDFRYRPRFICECSCGKKFVAYTQQKARDKWSVHSNPLSVADVAKRVRDEACRDNGDIPF